MTQRKRGAPRGNKNREISEEQRKRGANTNLSMDYETWQAFQAAIDLVEGHCLDDDEAYKEAWRSLCRGAVDGFVKAHHDLLDPEVMIL